MCPYLGLNFLIYEMGFKGTESLPLLPCYMSTSAFTPCPNKTWESESTIPSPNPLTPGLNNQLEKGTFYPRGGCRRCYPLPLEAVNPQSTPAESPLICKT